MNSHINFNNNNNKNIYDEVKNEPYINIQKERLQKRDFATNRNISLAHKINTSNKIYNSMEHIYEEVNYANETKPSKSLLKRARKKFSNSFKTIKNKKREGNSKVTEYKNQKQDQIINSDNDDYDYVCYSLNKLSSEQKKHLEYNNITIKSKFKKGIAAFKNKFSLKKKCCQDETNLQDTNHNLLMPSTTYNNYNIKTTRLLDESGYEVPICQHQNFLSRNHKQNITTINNKEVQIENYNTEVQIENYNTEAQIENYNTEAQIENYNTEAQIENYNTEAQIENYNTEAQIENYNTEAQIENYNTEAQIENYNTEAQIENYNTEAQIENSNEASTIKLQSTSLVKLRRTPKNLKVQPPIENKDNENLNNLQGIVHKRITMFEDFYNTNI